MALQSIYQPDVRRAIRLLNDAGYTTQQIVNFSDSDLRAVDVEVYLRKLKSVM